MIPRILFTLALLISTVYTSSSQPEQLKSPSEFLDGHYRLRFTPHHQLVSYFNYVASLSDKVNIVEYGKTYELRPLIAAIISNPQNIGRIEEIRQNNLRRTGMISGTPVKDDIAIVHLSYSVHGNEAAGSESSMAVLYTLAKGGPDVDTWLKNTVVIIDPSLNPDGYSRYTQWNNAVSSQPFNASIESREHDEPWPGGRVNHYYFDLNRDWAWQTQKESRDRIAFYRQWMPHVHADIHEMFGESTYYFAPAAQPYHPYLTPWQSEFQVEIGKNHATYFDREGWRYFTKELFDLFYPSYGDTYPMLSGAIGMTYEQAGHAAAGRALVTGNLDTLKLADRIDHHYTTSISTIEVSSHNASRLVNAFADYYKNSISNPSGNYKNFVIKKSNHRGRIYDLMKLLDLNGINYGILSGNGKQTKGYSYSSGNQATFLPEKGDLIIPASQPMSALLKTLFEPEAALADSMTYDITAWSVPMAYGLQTYSTNESLDFIPYDKSQVDNNVFTATRPYAYAIQWGSVPSSQLLASILAEGIIARYATGSFKVDGLTYNAGTILIMRADNRNFPSFDEVLQKKFMNSAIPVTAIPTGFVESGKDLGSESYLLVRNPQVLTIAGENISPTGLGQIWHFFEEELKYPLNIVQFDNIGNVNLNKYNVIVLPEGSYSFDNDFTQKLMAWMRTGGQVIAIGSAIRQFAGKDNTSLKFKSNGKEEKTTDEDPAHYPEAFDASLRKSLTEEIAGAVFRTAKDQTHPLSFGLGETYWTLKTSSASYAWLPAGANAIFLDANPTYYGFTGRKAFEKINKTLVAGREQIGGGGIVYLVDNPLFRSFWNSGKVLFSNALFF